MNEFTPYFDGYYREHMIEIESYRAGHWQIVLYARKQ